MTNPRALRIDTGKERVWLAMVVGLQAAVWGGHQLARARGLWTHDADRYATQGRLLADRVREAPGDGSADLGALLLHLPAGFEHGLAGGTGTDTMVAISGLLHLVLGGQSLLVGASVVALGLVGRILAWRALRQRHPQLATAGFVALLALPSVAWWTGALLKQTVVVGALAGAFAAVHRRALLPASLLVALALLVQPWIGLALLPAVVVWQARRRGLPFTGLALGAGVSAFLLAGLLELLGSDYGLWALRWQVVVRRGLAAGDPAASAFVLGEGLGTGWLADLLRLPLALWTGAFRPLPGEHRSVAAWLAGLENLGLVAVWGAAGWRAARRGWPRTGADAVGAATFALITCLGVGLASTNLGTLSRHRTLAVPILWMLPLALLREGAEPGDDRQHGAHSEEDAGGDVDE